VQTQKLLDRIALLLKVNVDDLLMEEPDPQAAVAYWRAEIEQGLAQAEDAVAAAIAQERQIERQLREAQLGAAKWDAKADEALHTGDEEQARAALRRKLTYECIANEAQHKLEHHRQVVIDMKAALSALKAKAQDLSVLDRPVRSGRNAT
jgi:phage shock protein A